MESAEGSEKGDPRFRGLIQVCSVLIAEHLTAQH